MRDEVIILDDGRPRARGDLKPRDIRQALGIENAADGPRLGLLHPLDFIKHLSEGRSLRQLRLRQLMVQVVPDLRQGGVTADEVDQGPGTRVATLAQDLNQTDQEILLLLQLVDLPLEGAAAPFIGSMVQRAFDAALDAVPARDHAGTLRGVSLRLRQWQRIYHRTTGQSTRSGRYLELASFTRQACGPDILPPLMGIISGGDPRRGGSQRAFGVGRHKDRRCQVNQSMTEIEGK